MVSGVEFLRLPGLATQYPELRDGLEVVWYAFSEQVSAVEDTGSELHLIFKSDVRLDSRFVTAVQLWKELGFSHPSRIAMEQAIAAGQSNPAHGQTHTALLLHGKTIYIGVFPIDVVREFRDLSVTVSLEYTHRATVEEAK